MVIALDGPIGEKWPTPITVWILTWFRPAAIDNIKNFNSCNSYLPIFLIGRIGLSMIMPTFAEPEHQYRIWTHRVFAVHLVRRELFDQRWQGRYLGDGVFQNLLSARWLTAWAMNDEQSGSGVLYSIVEVVDAYVYGYRAGKRKCRCLMQTTMINVIYRIALAWSEANYFWITVTKWNPKHYLTLSWRIHYLL